MKLREGITQDDLNQALMNAVLTALNAQGKTDTADVGGLGSNVGGSGASIPTSNASNSYENYGDDDYEDDTYEDDAYEDEDDLDLFGNVESGGGTTEETVPRPVTYENLQESQRVNTEPPVRNGLKSNEERITPTNTEEVVPRPLDLNDPAIVGRENVDGHVSEPASGRIEETITPRPVRYEDLAEDQKRPHANRVTESITPRPVRYEDLAEDQKRPHSNSNVNGGSGRKIIPFSVKQLPAVREQIPENVDFFTKSEEEKFKDVDHAVKMVSESMKAEASYIDLAADVTDMAIKRLKMYATKGVHDGAKKAYNNKKSDRHLEDNSLFSNDTVSIGGNPVKYTRHVEIPQWSLDLHECLSEGDKANNFDQVRMKITEELVNYFGGFKRINRVYVVSYQLIINDVCYIPKLSTQVLSRLPYDCADYIMNGNLAPFFNWSYLFKMNSLHTLSFDDVDFVTTYVADDVGIGRDFKPLLLFKHCKNLSTLCIGSDVIKYPLPEEESAREEMQQTIASVEYETHKSNYFYGKCEKYYGALFNGTKAVRQWSVGNLVNYAHNRGDKGLLRFTGGLIARTTVAAGLAVPEAVTRVAGGIFGGIASTLRSASQVATSQGNSDTGGNTQDGL